MIHIKNITPTKPLWDAKRLYYKSILSGLAILVFWGLTAFAYPVQRGDSQTPSPHKIYLPIIFKHCYCYYVDSVNGSDANPGTSTAKPWRTLAPVRATNFPPGSVIHFKRGSTLTGDLNIDTSGASGNPITFTAYGEGDPPVFRNPGNSSNRTRAIIIYADWVIVENLMIRDTYDAGILILPGSDRNIVRNNEFTNTGFGVQINGKYNLFTHNYVHDLHMVVNTPGGDDDYGAVGVGLSNAANNEVSYNRFVNCKAASYDYTVDGGAVEWYGDQVDNNYVHHNWAAQNDGFLEVGGGSASNNIVAYNVSIDNGRFSHLNISGKFQSAIHNFRVENNTIIERPQGERHWVVFSFAGNPPANTFIIRNNIIYLDNFSYVATQSTIQHDHNLYSLNNGTALGLTLGTSEIIGNPQFANLSEQKFHLQSLSPAIDKGINLGYTLDFDEQPVPVGSAPDLGAYEYQ